MRSIANKGFALSERRMDMPFTHLIESTTALLVALPTAVAVWQMARGRRTTSNTNLGLSPLTEVDQLLQDMQKTIKNMHALYDKADHSSGWRNLLDGTNRQLANMSESIEKSMEQIERLADTRVVGQAEHPTLERIEAISIHAAFGMQDEDFKLRAHLYLSMGQNFDASGHYYTLAIAGNQGFQKLTFASGTSRTDMVSAFNQFQHKTGVGATASDEALIRLSSRSKGKNQFVAARRVSGVVDNLILNRKKRRGSNRKIEFGRG